MDSVFLKISFPKETLQMWTVTNVISESSQYLYSNDEKLFLAPSRVSIAEHEIEASSSPW